MSLDNATDGDPTRPAKRPWMQTVREAPVTTLLFAICVLVFLVAETVGNTRSTATLVSFGAVGRRWVWAGDYWRLVTALFLHIGPLHLGANVLFGFRLCAQAEEQLGPWRFLALYLGSGIAGSAVSVIGQDGLSAGASGALFGVVGWLLVTLRIRAGSLRAFMQHPAIRQQLIWIAGWFVLGAFIGFDNYAHAGGMLFGGLFAWALAADPRTGQNRRARLAVALGIGIVLVAASLHPLPILHPPPRAGLVPPSDA